MDDRAGKIESSSVGARYRVRWEIGKRASKLSKPDQARQGRESEEENDPLRRRPTATAIASHHGPQPSVIQFPSRIGEREVNQSRTEEDGADNETMPLPTNLQCSGTQSGAARENDATHFPLFRSSSHPSTFIVFIAATQPAAADPR